MRGGSAQKFWKDMISPEQNFLFLILFFFPHTTSVSTAKNTSNMEN